MKYFQAKELADEVINKLGSHCVRIEIAGSIRRKKANVKDIEIVCIPKMKTPAVRSSSWHMAVFNLGDIRKGKLKDGKFIQIWLREGIMVDLFVATPDNWGLIYAIRTGSADFSHKTLATQWVKKGFKSEGGILMKGGESFPVREEEELFELIGLEYVSPEKRI